MSISHLPTSFGEVTWSFLGLWALLKTWLFATSFKSYQVTSPREVMFHRFSVKMSKIISNSLVSVCWAWVLQHFTAVGFFWSNWGPKPDTKTAGPKIIRSVILSSTVLRHGDKKNPTQLTFTAVETRHVRKGRRIESRKNITDRPTYLCREATNKVRKKQNERCHLIGNRNIGWELRLFRWKISVIQRRNGKLLKFRKLFMYLTVFFPILTQARSVGNPGVTNMFGEFQESLLFLFLSIKHQQFFFFSENYFSLIPFSTMCNDKWREPGEI